MQTRTDARIPRILGSAAMDLLSLYILANGKIYNKLVTDTAFFVPLPIAFGSLLH
jgi:hypothetical protein